jgi:dTDP-4-amino-4,6-dideoxygalactose transaminase
LPYTFALNSNSILSFSNDSNFSEIVKGFIDSLEETLQLDSSKIEPAITSNTKAIIVPHLYGFACDMDEIMQIAKKLGHFVEPLNTLPQRLY